MYCRWITNYIVARLNCFSVYALSPRILSIETTERCNLDCVMCPRKQTSISNKEFTLKQFEYTLSLFPRINTVILLGRGETFMMKDIFSILDFGSRKNIHFTIVTNGIMLTAETIKKIPNTGKMLVSIDHPHADKYKEIRRGGDLNVIISNLKVFKKIKPQQWVCIQTVIMDKNIDYMEDLIKLAKEVSADAVKLIYPVIFDSAMSKIHTGSSMDVIVKLKKVKAYAKKAGIRFVAIPLINKPRVCIEPWISLRIALNGDIYPCCYIDNSNESLWCEWYKGSLVEVPQASYAMGNIYDASIGGMWNGKTFKSLRKTVINTQKNTLMSDEYLKNLRKNIISKKRFAYCSACLYRQNKAC